MRIRVKICGITCVEDALAAIDAGADALGFVFYEKSPRNVSIAQAQAIIEKLPVFISTVALFVNAEKTFVEAVVEQTKVDLLQFHGDELASYCAGFTRPYIKAVRMQETTDLVSISKAYPSARALLLDTYVKGIPGGTGASFNWHWLSALPESFSHPVILAGGLTPDNINQAIKIVNPYAVDVSGGVEASPGKKSIEAIKQFMDGVV